jgi:pseudouridine kinase
MQNSVTGQPVLCIGAAMIDDSYYCLEEPLPGTSNPATHLRSAGGVARNIAHHLAQLGNRVELISHFGTEADGTWLTDQCRSAGIALSHSRFTGLGTGRFAAIVSPAGELFAGASDALVDKTITVTWLAQRTPLLATASLILCDCNLSSSCIEWILAFCRTHSIPCVLEPVSVAKASPLAGMNLADVLLVTPNRAELAALSGSPISENVEASIERLLERGVQNIWMRKGREGSELFSRKEIIRLPAPDVEVLDTTGAGDAALAGWIHAWLRKKDARECMIYGHAMAAIILATKGAIAASLHTDLLERTAANLRTQ